MQIDQFAVQAGQYLLSRPRYPQTLIKQLTNCFGKNAHKVTCLDVACGSGQLTIALAEIFSKIDAIDRSSAQLKQATPHARIKYHQVPNATNLQSFAKDETYDCVTIAQAFHWMECTPTLMEFHRVLKPGGVLAIFGYGACSIINPIQAQKEFENYYHNILGSHFEQGDPRCLWECDRIRLDSAHATDKFEPFTNVERTWFRESKQLTVREFTNYLETWSAYQQLKNKQEALEPLRISLGDVNSMMQIVIPFWLILARKV